MTIEKIIRGFLQFRRSVLPTLAPIFQRLAQAQTPSVLLVACSDSRVVPNRVASSDPGEVFEVRCVGNFIAPASGDGVSVGDVSEAAALEYALGVLDIQDIIIMGHSHCGAMKALLGQGGSLAGAPNLADWLAHGKGAKDRVEQLKFEADLPDYDRLSQANVLVQLEHVMTYPIVRDRVASGRVDLHGAWLDVGTGDLHLHDPAERAFLLLDEKEAERRLTMLVDERPVTD